MYCKRRVHEHEIAQPLVHCHLSQRDMKFFAWRFTSTACSFADQNANLYNRRYVESMLGAIFWGTLAVGIDLIANNLTNCYKWMIAWWHCNYITSAIIISNRVVRCVLFVRSKSVTRVKSLRKRELVGILLENPLIRGLFVEFRLKTNSTQS